MNAEEEYPFKKKETVTKNATAAKPKLHSFMTLITKENFQLKKNESRA